MDRAPEGRIRAVLFDLDGTLLETRGDIATAANLALADRGLGPLPIEEITRFVGRGSRILVTRCLAACGVDAPRDAAIDGALADFVRHYHDHILDTTFVYDGVVSMLESFRSAEIAMGIVTNKPLSLAEGTLDGLRLRGFFGVVLGGESLAVRKPDPAPLLHALGMLRADAAEAAMVGDMDVDIQAGRAAGMRVAAVAWGFSASEDLATARPDFLAPDPAALVNWIVGSA